MSETRPLNVIAWEIRQVWERPYFGAEPYIAAMESLTEMTDHIGHDRADDVVIRFLINARTWRGPDARRIKAELKSRLP
jgi:hypothetical protein